MTDLPDQYEEKLQASKALVEQADSLPERFCTLYSSLPHESETSASHLINRLGVEISAYQEQYDILQQQLGILCPPSQSHAPLASRFFTSLLDLFQLANTIYQTEEDNLQSFDQALQSVYTLLNTGSFQPPSDPQARALLKALLPLAWGLSSFKTTPQAYMKHVTAQQGGKRKTRKQKRKSTSA